MPTYDSHLQAAVDATSVAKDSGVTDLLGYLREQLAEREIETSDEDWLQRMVEGINGDPNFMIDSEPSDYDARR
jgi:predicted nuclease of restriction endonuclease-like (RecB) superfamily